MEANFFISVNADEIGVLIDILDRARKDSKKLSKSNNGQNVRVKVESSSIGKLEEEGIKYSKELTFVDKN